LRGRHGSLHHCAHRRPNFTGDRCEVRGHGAAHAALPPGSLHAGCACWCAPDGFASRKRRGATQGAATPEGARRGGPPPAWSSLMGLLRPHLAVAPAPGAPTMHGAITHDPSSRHPELFVSIPDSAKKNHLASPKRVASSVKGCVATRFQFRVACRDTKKSTPRNFRYLVNSEL